MCGDGCVKVVPQQATAGNVPEFSNESWPCLDYCPDRTENCPWACETEIGACSRGTVLGMFH